MPYVHLVHQFMAEDLHGQADDGHEVVRRMGYAQHMLEAFGKELEGFEGAAEDFCSKVLTPVLQRQLCSIPDSYASVVRDCLATDLGGEVTIANATCFYLGNNPLNPAWIPSYRCNIIYIRDAFWHLAVVDGSVTIGDFTDFNIVIDNYDIVMEAMKKKVEENGSEGEDDDQSRIPDLSVVEVMAIFHVSLQDFFEPELRLQVCLQPYSAHKDTNCLPIARDSCGGIQAEGRDSRKASRLVSEPTSPTGLLNRC